MGWLLSLISILLVSGAQLLMKLAMIQLPAITQPSAFLAVLRTPSLAGVLLLSGLLAYAFSMLCWLQALKRLPLSRLYPLLALSYLLVWAVALCLPPLNEVFLWSKLAGSALILAGVLLICWPGARPS